MTAISAPRNSDAITIFGNHWPEVDGIAYIYQRIERNCHVDTRYSISSLCDFLLRNPEKKCILMIQPHHHAYFLYTLAQQLPQATIKIVTDTLFLSDRVIVDTLGFTDVTTVDDFIHARWVSLLPTNISQFTSLPRWDEADFFDFMNKKILHGLHAWG